MKKVAGIIVSVVFLLSACSSLDTPPQDLTALALPGAPGNSWSYFHGSGNFPSGHRATVVGKRTVGNLYTLTYVYQPDSYIPLDSYFSVDLLAPHDRSKVKVTVSPSLPISPIICTWKLGKSLYTGQFINCSGTLLEDMLYTVAVEEYGVITTKAYFRTNALTYSP
jgi:hypothetical protein